MWNKEKFFGFQVFSVKREITPDAVYYGKRLSLFAGLFLISDFETSSKMVLCCHLLLSLADAIIIVSFRRYCVLDSTNQFKNRH